MLVVEVPIVLLPTFAFLVFLVMGGVMLVPPIVPGAAAKWVEPPAPLLVDGFRFRFVVLVVTVPPVIVVPRIKGGPNPGTTIPHCLARINCTSWTSTILLPRCCANLMVC